jgi:catechol 2,3-dioxygenase-like lactoylglutathione lyase family enzyme
MTDVASPARPVAAGQPQGERSLVRRIEPAWPHFQEDIMLGKSNAVANLAVRDLDRSRAFFTDKLGLKEVDNQGDELVVLKSGDSVVNVYRSEYAGTNEATAVTWAVDDIDSEVEALKNKGVQFEHYDMPGLTREGDVHVGEGMKVAWFKDPDGNILNIVEE